MKGVSISYPTLIDGEGGHAPVPIAASWRALEETRIPWMARGTRARETGVCCGAPGRKRGAMRKLRRRALLRGRGGAMCDAEQPRE